MSLYSLKIATPELKYWIHSYSPLFRSRSARVMLIRRAVVGAKAGGRRSVTPSNKTISLFDRAIPLFDGTIGMPQSGLFNAACGRARCMRKSSFLGHLGVILGLVVIMYSSWDHMMISFKWASEKKKSPRNGVTPDNFGEVI